MSSALSRCLRLQGSAPGYASRARAPRPPGRSPPAIVSRLTFLWVATGRWQARWAPGTCGLVMDGATLAKVPDAVIAEIRSREREGAIDLLPKIRPGDQVRVLRGPFRDQLPIYAGMSGRDRVAVLLRLLGVSAGSSCTDAMSRSDKAAPRGSVSRGRLARYFQCHVIARRPLPAGLRAIQCRPAASLRPHAATWPTCCHCKDQ